MYEIRSIFATRPQSHLTELVSDKGDCGQFGNIEAGLFMVNDEDDNTRVTGEFHEEADWPQEKPERSEAVRDNGEETDELAGELDTQEKVREMLGDWIEDDTTIPPLQLGNKHLESASPCQNVSRTSSQLSIDAPVRAYEHKRQALTVRQTVKVVTNTKLVAEVENIKQQLDFALRYQLWHWYQLWNCRWLVLLA